MTYMDGYLGPELTEEIIGEMSPFDLASCFLTSRTTQLQSIRDEKEGIIPRDISKTLQYILKRERRLINNYLYRRTDSFKEEFRVYFDNPEYFGIGEIDDNSDVYFEDPDSDNIDRRDADDDLDFPERFDD